MIPDFLLSFNLHYNSNVKVCLTGVYVIDKLAMWLDYYNDGLRNLEFDHIYLSPQGWINLNVCELISMKAGDHNINWFINNDSNEVIRVDYGF